MVLDLPSSVQHYRSLVFNELFDLSLRREPCGPFFLLMTFSSYFMTVGERLMCGTFLFFYSY